MSNATRKLRQDKFYRLAKEQGYRSRAAFKLLDRRFRFLPTARAVLDLGAAPGGWVQVAVSSATAGALVVGVDLKPIWPIRGARLLRADITATARCSAAVRKLMDSKGVTAFDVVLHDGVGQIKKRKCDGAQEAARQSALVIDAVRLATMFLAPKGTFITKFIRSHDLNAIMFCLKQLFEKVQVTKSIASRTASAEIYFVCLEYKAPAKIQPELFDLNHLFTVSLENKPGDEVPKGVKTDKGFKEIHIGQAAKALTQLVGYDVTTIQVTNHLRKWKIRYQRIEKLRLLSGALWDDDQKMIVLEDQHYLGHTQDTPKDAEFLNTPLVNYEYMEACFVNKLATGKFAMGSNEPLGKPIEVEGPEKPIDLEGGETNGEGPVQGEVPFDFGVQGLGATTPSPSGSTNNKKRKRVLSDEDAVQLLVL
ncbi:hypothetical protein ACQ4PT_042056 [Festuca glaucescens]